MNWWLLHVTLNWITSRATFVILLKTEQSSYFHLGGMKGIIAVSTIDNRGGGGIGDRQ